MPEKQINILARAHIGTYGKVAESKARARAQALADVGRHDVAEVWRQVVKKIVASSDRLFC